MPHTTFIFPAPLAGPGEPGDVIVRVGRCNGAFNDVLDTAK